MKCKSAIEFDRTFTMESLHIPIVTVEKPHVRVFRLTAVKFPNNLQEQLNASVQVRVEYHYTYNTYKYTCMYVQVFRKSGACKFRGPAKALCRLTSENGRGHAIFPSFQWLFKRKLCNLQTKTRRPGDQRRGKWDFLTSRLHFVAIFLQF